MRCSKGEVKHRIALGGGHPNNYTHSLRGHTWKKTPDGRICEKCGKKVVRLHEK